jgi:protoheme IX farnesyltransferase
VKSAQAGAAPVPVAAARRASVIGDYVALAKPRLNFLVVLSSAAAYYLGAVGRPDWWAMGQAVAGTALVAGGAAALNQVYERDTDRLMRRTRLRPLPDGRVRAEDARAFGLVLAAAGLALLGRTANLAAALLAGVTLIVYLIVYTPMKRRSAAATLIGAVPGALPPLIGWTAARGTPDAGGWTLFAIVFVWQIPHFMAIAWMYRDDYRSAGFPMLPVIEPDGRRTGQHALLYAAALLPISLAPFWFGIAGTGYLWTAAVLGAAFLWLAARFHASRTDAAARWLFFGSITYLPLLWAAMILDH